MAEFDVVDMTAFVRYLLSNLSTDVALPSGEVIDVAFDATSDGYSREVAVRAVTRAGSQLFRLTVEPMSSES